MSSLPFISVQAVQSHHELAGVLRVHPWEDLAVQGVASGCEQGLAFLAQVVVEFGLNPGPQIQT